MTKCSFKCPNKLLLSFEDRLSYASEVFVNSLSDREENDVSDFFGFAELLIDDIKHTKPFYLVMSVPGVYGVNLINTVTTDEVDRIDKWLHSVDEQAAQNYAELRFKRFTGGL